MATTCKLITKTVLSSDTADIEFTNIPSTYTDLYIVGSIRSTRANTNDACKARINGAASDTSHSSRLLYSDGASAASGTTSYLFVADTVSANNTANTFTSFEMYVPNYAGSTNKSFSITHAHETNGSTAYIGATAAQWSSTSAITSIRFFLLTGPNFKSGSSFYLYGITKMDDGEKGYFGTAATGGDEVYTTGNGYKVHVFKNSGTLNVTAPGEVEYLVIAGGGGGGGSFAGGGGAGGYRSSVSNENSGGGSTTEPKKLINAGSYPIIVGAGGTAGSVLNVSPYTRTTATAGTQSSFMDIISTGGGRSPYDAYADIPDQAAGGSGAGGNGASNSTRRGGYGVSGQGTNGGNGIDGGISNTFSGGGGGAGTAGTTAVGTVAGNGGNGLASSITGTSITRAGGGGGGLGNTGTPGTGGSGGGGNASASSQAAAGSGTINTGSGGGGGSYFGNLHGSGGSGGSGIVIIRYRI